MSEKSPQNMTTDELEEFCWKHVEEDLNDCGCDYCEELITRREDEMFTAAIGEDASILHN